MKLSIIIPCLQRQQMLDRLLSQLILQMMDRCDVEVIVVDDGSQPPLEIVNSPNIRLLRNNSPMGAPGARQRGFAQSTGQYIHFHDSDDLLGHEWIANIIRATAQEPAPDMIVTSRLIVAKNGLVSFWSANKIQKVGSTVQRLLSFQRFINRIGPLGGVTFGRRAAQHIVFHKTPASQDWLMYDDVLYVAKNIYFDLQNYFLFNNHSTLRISNNARSRAKGYVFAARHRFKNRRMQRLATRLYCAHGADDLAPLVLVRHRWLKRTLCEILARFPLLTGRRS